MLGDGDDDSTEHSPPSRSQEPPAAAARLNNTTAARVRRSPLYHALALALYGSGGGPFERYWHHT